MSPRWDIVQDGISYLTASNSYLLEIHDRTYEVVKNNWIHDQI